MQPAREKGNTANNMDMPRRTTLHLHHALGCFFQADGQLLQYELVLLRISKSDIVAKGSDEHIVYDVTAVCKSSRDFKAESGHKRYLSTSTCLYQHENKILF